MNRRITRQGELKQRRSESFVRFFIPISHIDELKLLAQPVTNPLRFRQDLTKTRRKRAGHGHSSIRWIDHLASLLCGLRESSASGSIFPPTPRLRRASHSIPPFLHSSIPPFLLSPITPTL